MEVVKNDTYIIKVVGVYQDKFVVRAYERKEDLFEILIPTANIKGYGHLIVGKVSVGVEIDNLYPENVLKFIIDTGEGLYYPAFIPESLQKEIGEDLLGKILELYLDPETTLERILKRNPYSVKRYGRDFENRGLSSSKVFRRLW